MLLATKLVTRIARNLRGEEVCHGKFPKVIKPKQSSSHGTWEYGLLRVVQDMNACEFSVWPDPRKEQEEPEKCQSIGSLERELAYVAGGTRFQVSVQKRTSISKFGSSSAPEKLRQKKVSSFISHNVYSVLLKVKF